MIIKYKDDKYIKEKKEIEIEDTKNVFLKGRNKYDNLPTYFGIWENNGGLSIVTIISYRTISYKYYLHESIYTECDIREYLRNNKKVEIIEKDEFKEQLEHVNSILKM